MRMNMRRFTRLTNAFSKKVENLRAAVALHFMNYDSPAAHQPREGFWRRSRKTFPQSQQKSS
jgi:hypothetical protein